MPPTKKTVCIDFDGVIAQYDGWKGHAVLGDPIEGASEALKKFKNAEWQIIIFTTRLDSSILRDYLKENDIVYDYINHNPDQYPHTNNGKPAAHLYIDDRAVNFAGNWDETYQTAINFVPWNRK